MINIEKHIPVPGRNKYPLGDMEVGDSFAMPVQEGWRASDFATKIRSAATAYCERAKSTAKFSVRLVENKTLARCWRIA